KTERQSARGSEGKNADRRQRSSECCTRHKNRTGHTGGSFENFAANLHTKIAGEISEFDLPQTENEKEDVQKLPVRNVIGRLWWLALISRPDIQCALHRCAIWQNRPSQKLWKFLMHILQYL